MKKIRIFISSPSDVVQERQSLFTVIRQLNYEFASYFILEPIMWENLPLDVSSSFQDGIDYFISKDGIDIAVFVLGSRLGSPINKKMRDGSLYNSGTVYEFEMALNAREQSVNKKPIILAYRSKRSFVEYIPNKELFKDEIYLKQCFEDQKKVNVFFDEYFKNKEGMFNTRAYHEFESVTVFGQKVKEHLRVLLHGLLPKNGARIAIFHGCPFKGLQSFDFDDEPIFFGREKAINEIVEKLKNQAEDHKPFVLVIGQSGSGKSSLIKAGVLPRIVLSGPVDNIDWRLSMLSPGQYAGNLYEAFIESLTQPKAFPELKEMDKTRERIKIKFLQDAETVCWQIEDLINTVAERQQHRREVRLLLFIDQFEEIFTHQNIPQQNKLKFFELLNRLADSMKVWIIATIRSDYYANFQDSHLLKLRGKYGLYDLLNPNSNELKEIIMEPAIRAGLIYEKDELKGTTLENLILNDIKGNTNVLPLLEFALTELYHRKTSENFLTIQSYYEFGGINGALASRAETCYNEMPENLKKAFPSVISSLIGVNKDTKRPYRKHSNFEEAIKNEDHRQIIDHFTKARLFVADKDEKNQPYVALVHEALIENWFRISDWFINNLIFLEKEAYIKEQNYHWRNNGKEKAFLMTKIQQLNTAEYLEKEWSAHLEDEDKEFISLSRKSILRRNIEYWALFFGLSFIMFFLPESIRSWFNLPNSITDNIKLVGAGILIPSFWEILLKLLAFPRYRTRFSEVAFWTFSTLIVLFYLIFYQSHSDNYINYFFVISFFFVTVFKAFSKWYGNSVEKINNKTLKSLVLWSNNNMVRHFYITALFFLFVLAIFGGAYEKKVKRENVKELLTGNVETFVKLLDAKAEILEMKLNQQTSEIRSLLNSVPNSTNNSKSNSSFFRLPNDLQNNPPSILTSEIREELLNFNTLNAGHSLCFSNEFFRLENSDTVLIPVSYDEIMFKTPDYIYNSNAYPQLKHLNKLIDVFKGISNSGNNRDLILWQYVGFENGLFGIFPWNIFEDLKYDPTKRIWFNTPVDSIAWHFYKFSSTNQLGFTCAKGFSYQNNLKGISAIDASLYKIINGFMPSYIKINNISAFLLDIENNQQPIIWSNKENNYKDRFVINQIIESAHQTNIIEYQNLTHAQNIEFKSLSNNYAASYAYCRRLKLLCVFLYNENN